jgi:hypothetical protein
MKPAVLVLALAAACQADLTKYPEGPGGGRLPGGGGGGPDGGTGDGGDTDGGPQLTGRVCLLSDLRDVTGCAGNAKGLRVSLGTRTATTVDAAGSFTISAPQGAGFTWRVVGDTADRIITSVMPFGTDNTIPVIGFEDYQQLLGTNTAAVGALQGSIMVRVVKGTVPVTGVTATLAGQDQVFYDALNSELDWNTGTVGTGRNGMVWIPGVTLPVPATTTLSVVLSPPGATVVTAPAVVEDQAITFVTRDLQ